MTAPKLPLKAGNSLATATSQPRDGFNGKSVRKLSSAFHGHLLNENNRTPGGTPVNVGVPAASVHEEPINEAFLLDATRQHSVRCVKTTS